MSLLPIRTRRLTVVLAAMLACVAVAAQGSTPELPAIWPSPNAAGAVSGQAITFPSRSPYSLTDVGDGERDPPQDGQGTLFMPKTASAENPVPAVVMLHGASGVRSSRELTYGRQFAAMGIAALAVDAFASRRDRATGFTERLIEITETMLLADAYAALDYLDKRPEVDGSRVVLIGFSYGGMAARYAAYAQVADLFAPEGPRFAGHVSFYSPCIARFEDTRATGAPVLILIGGKDEIVDPDRCDLIADDLRTGGAPVEVKVYPEGYHQWDGGPSSPRRIGRDLSGCRFTVDPKGVVHESWTRLPMVDTLTRKLILGLCSGSDGYVLLRDESVRAQSNRDLGAFLAEAFSKPTVIPARTPAGTTPGR
ncbi:MAG: dienelactone hydrolase [Rhodospirillaceae bacterium]|nr:dienelactone hydrolase [Rhodospirillaceae bacterium]